MCRYITGNIKDRNHAARWDSAPQVIARFRQKFGGLTNRTYFAYVGGKPRYAIRIGFDPYRTRQTSVIQCTLAAHTLGLGPRLVYAEPNLSVTDFVVGTGNDGPSDRPAQPR